MEETTKEAGAAKSELTKLDKLHALPWSVGFDVANTFFLQFTFFGSAFVLFLNELQFDKTEIGFLLAVFPFLGLISLLITPFVARFGYKRSLITFFGIRTLFAGLLILTPLFVRPGQVWGVLLFVGLVTIAFAIARSVGMTAMLPWQQEYIPNEIRGKYSAYSGIFVSLAGLLAVAIAGYVIELNFGLPRYSILFGLGVVSALVSLYLVSHIPGGIGATQVASILKNRKEMLAPLRDGRFVRYLTGLGLYTLSTAPVFAFLPIFMQDQVGLTPGNVVFLQTGVLVGSLMSSFFWGWVADRYGSKPVALSGLLLTATLPVGWYFMPRNASLSLLTALLIAGIQGIATTGWSIGSGRMLYVSLVPSQSEAAYLSQYNAWLGLIGGISSIFGGRLLDALSGFQAHFIGLTLNAYGVLFGAALLFTMVSVFMIRSIHTASEIGVSEFAGMFLHGNPFLAAGIYPQ